jgi:hypothetical protein
MRAESGVFQPGSLPQSTGHGAGSGVLPTSEVLPERPERRWRRDWLNLEPPGTDPLTAGKL